MLKPCSKTIWTGTQIAWEKVLVDGFYEGMAAVIQHRQPRLPLYQEKYLMAVVVNHKLMIFKITSSTGYSVSSADALLTVKAANVTLGILDEWFPWPPSEAVYARVTAVDFMKEYNPQRLLHQGILDSFHKKPLPGWWPVHRGTLGVSFVRNTLDRSMCTEIRADECVLYRGPFEMNEELCERKVIKVWSIDKMDLEVMKPKLPDPEDIIQCRLMMRWQRKAAYDWLLNNEYPF